MSEAYRDDVVALFPGQGSIQPGAGEPWRDEPQWPVVDRVSDATGVDVAALLLRADGEELVRTDNAQLATFALSLLGFEALLAIGVRPRYYLGHSLGEFSALVAAGHLDFTAGARLVAARGAAMAEAATLGAGSMVALMGADESAHQRLGDLEDLWVANVNGPGQVVVSGRRGALDTLLRDHRDFGWRRATALPVGGAFHSPLMAPAQSALDHALDATTFMESSAIVIANVDGRAHDEPEDWPALLSRQLTSPVQFLAATRALPESVQCTIELPPGDVLTGLTRRIRPFVTQRTLRTPSELEELSA